MAEAWCSVLRRGVESTDPDERREPLALETMRNYQGAVRRFVEYLLDPGYPWATQIERAFGRRVTQLFDEFNRVRHPPAESGAKSTGRFPIPRDVLQQVFDFLDDRVDKARGKTMLPKARDSAIFKTFYAYGLRRQELALTELPDLSYNP
jgi:hypothetical protein